MVLWFQPLVCCKKYTIQFKTKFPGTQHMIKCFYEVIHGKPTSDLWSRYHHHVTKHTRESHWPGIVTIGVPAQSTSMPVVWPLQRGVSRQTSASWPRLTCSSFGATGEKIMRLAGRPMFWAYCWMLGSPTAGKRNSQRTLFGTRFRIWKWEKKQAKKKKITYFCTNNTKEWRSPRILLGCAYIGPHLQSWWVNLVELVEVTVDNGVLRQTILRASGHHNCSRNLFSCGSLVIDLFFFGGG